MWTGGSNRQEPRSAALRAPPGPGVGVELAQPEGPRCQDHPGDQGRSTEEEAPHRAP